MLTREEVIWAGGLFEGEGCLSLWQRGSYTPQIKAGLVSTDEDAVRRFHAALGVGSVRGPSQNGGSDKYKPVWEWQSSGFPSTQAAIGMLWPGLGVRRKARAREVLLAGRGPRRARGRQGLPDEPQYKRVRDCGCGSRGPHKGVCGAGNEPQFSGGCGVRNG